MLLNFTDVHRFGDGRVVAGEGRAGHIPFVASTKKRKGWKRSPSRPSQFGHDEGQGSHTLSQNEFSKKKKNRAGSHPGSPINRCVPAQEQCTR